jgi:FKBP-type peptidyl-prolyl cis-trans isomerase
MKIFTACFLLLLQADSTRSWSLNRRHLFKATPAVAALIAGTSSASAVILEPEEIQKTITGVQYRDDRVGSGPEISPKDVLVMHIQGMTRDGSIIVDTRADGRPILHQLGSVQDFEFFGGDSGKRPIVTLGVEDGMRGMKWGGVRRIVVPSPLAYGSAGVSRFDAMRMGLKRPVPRDEMLRYEVELLRCLDVTSTDTGLVAQACCTEPNYPCNTETDSDNTTAASSQ